MTNMTKNGSQMKIVPLTIASKYEILRNNTTDVRDLNTKTIKYY